MKDDPNTPGYITSIKPRYPHLRHIPAIQDNDAHTLMIKEKEYDASWKQRGGVGAFMMLARKWDRLENQLRGLGYDIFKAIRVDTREEGVLDDIRDLRRYLTLVEAEMIEQGVIGPPAMERTNWDSLNAASRERSVLRETTDALRTKFDTDQRQDKPDTFGVDPVLKEAEQLLNKKAPWEPCDRPLTEMIKRDEGNEPCGTPGCGHPRFVHSGPDSAGGCRFNSMCPCMGFTNWPAQVRP